jgi:hypothetical protein
VKNCTNAGNNYVKQVIKLSLLAIIAMSFQTSVSAADWLTLQAVEPDFVAPQGVLVPNRNKVPKVWGFLQFNYRKDMGNVVVNSGGINTTPFSLLQPDLTDQSGFNLFRARLGMRGMADDDNLVDYFVLTDFGNNGVGNPNGKKEVGTYITDASVTLRHIPGANIRAGMFKTPGSEEGLGSVYYYPYVEFTSFTDGQLLERTIKKTGVAEVNGAAGGATTTHYTGVASDAVGAFRDTGLEIFDTFPIAKDWTFSYAYMLGNGSGISLSSSNDNKTQYGYLAVEKNFGGGKGYYTNAMKFYVWGQDGKRTLLVDKDNNTSTTPYDKKTYDRNRYGVGASYFNNGLRLEAEYAKAEGMIFTGAKDINTDPAIDDWSLQYAVGKENKADGGYVNAQYYVVPDKLELITRYDWMNRLTNSAAGRRDFETTTVGFSYHFKEATRLDFNYAFKSTKAPGNASAQTTLDNTGDRVSIQLTAGF